MAAQDAEARARQLKSECVHITFEVETYDRFVRLMRLAAQHLDDIDPALYELDNKRLAELNQVISAPVRKSGGKVTLKLSHMDLFDLETTSHMAEGFPRSFGGEAALGMDMEELAALTDALESYRKRAFAEQYSKD